MLTFSECRSLMASARAPENGKPLQNNTRLYERMQSDGTTYYAVQLHATDVVDILPSGYYRLRTGGWQTVTTKDRIRTYAPVGWHPLTVEGEWYMPVRPSESDPEPQIRERGIPKPYHAPDPGPEPVKDPNGCIAGTTGATEDWSGQLVAVEYGEEKWRYGGRVRYEQCGHCAEFDKRHARWDAAMHGTYYGRGQGKGYVRMCEMLERFETRDAWQDAYITAFRQERADRKVHREWWARNWVAWSEGIRIDANGYVPRKDAEYLLKLERKIARAARRMEREREQQERERRQIERFKERMRRHRAERPTFEQAAATAAETLRELNMTLQANGS